MIFPPNFGLALIHALWEYCRPYHLVLFTNVFINPHIQDLGTAAVGDDLSQSEAHNAHQLALLEARLNEILTPSSITQSRLQRDVQVITLLDGSNSLQPELQSEEYYNTPHIDGDTTDGDDDCAFNTRLCHRLATKLSSIGYGVLVRHSVSGGKGSEMFNNLRNDFLVVTALSSDHSTSTPTPTTSSSSSHLQEFIIGPCFQDHFTIPHHTARYTGLLSLLPTTLVATPSQLKQLVNLLCAEMHIAFEQCGFSLPPWRKAQSLLSKWLPSKAKDVDMSPGGSPRWCSTPIVGGDGSACCTALDGKGASAHHSQQQHYNKQAFNTSSGLMSDHRSTSTFICFDDVVTCSNATTATATPIGRVESPRAILQQASVSLLKLKEEQCHIAAQRSLLTTDLAGSGDRSITVEQNVELQQDNRRRGQQAFKIKCQAHYSQPAIITVKRRGAA